MKSLWLPLVAASGVAAACYSGSPDVSATGTGKDGSVVTPTPSGSDGGAVVASGKGIPCDVEALLVAKCASCHGATPRAGAPMSLVTYDDLVKEIPGEPGVTYIKDSIELMQSTTEPMPPSGLLPASSVAVLQAWLDAGLPAGTCGLPKTDADGGAVAPPDPYATPMTCTTNAFYTRGHNTSMEPGNACIQCHSQQGEGPGYTIAGTVYKTAHEKNRCNGGVAGTKVVITGADGKVLTLTPNAVGNFYSSAVVAKPYTAKVVSAAGEREMAGPQSNGDCNSCHTPDGTQGAPGRVMAP